MGFERFSKAPESYSQPRGGQVSWSKKICSPPHFECIRFSHDRIYWIVGDNRIFNKSECISLQLCVMCWLWILVSLSHSHTHADPTSYSVCFCPRSSPRPMMPALSSVDVFFRPEVQRLSCPQHVLVLRSAAARTCDDRVCERWGVSGVKCVYRGCMAS